MGRLAKLLLLALVKLTNSSELYMLYLRKYVIKGDWK